MVWDRQAACPTVYLAVEKRTARRVRVCYYHRAVLSSILPFSVEGTGKQSVPLVPPQSSGAARRRKPRLLLAFVGALVFRLAAVQFSAWLFQLPPRMTREEPLDYSPFLV